MMILVANLRISGFFALVNAWVMRRVHRPMLLLAAIVAVSGVFSAFLVNDAICLVMAPLVLELTLGLGRNPVPYLLAVAMASNVGSTATITGNPQNMMIGSFSRIPYPEFAAALAPVALIGLLLTVVLLASPLIHLLALFFHTRWLNFGSRLPWDAFVYFAIAPVVGALMLRRHERARFSSTNSLPACVIRSTSPRWPMRKRARVFPLSAPKWAIWLMP
jgi:Na+/H+ antiporter NhaD/arsenite permease-like protein